jgi:hypothetical protein
MISLVPAPEPNPSFHKFRKLNLFPTLQQSHRWQMPFDAAVPLSDHSGGKIVEQRIGRIIWVDDFDSSSSRRGLPQQPTTMIAADRADDQIRREAGRN